MTKECMIRATTLYDSMQAIQDFNAGIDSLIKTGSKIGNIFLLEIKYSNRDIAPISIHVDKRILTTLKETLNENYKKYEKEFTELTPESIVIKEDNDELTT